MLWVKSFHIIFMVTWFAGLFYLPRLFVYHASCEDNKISEQFKIMERKLMIMTHIGGSLTIVFGLWLLSFYSAESIASMGWLHAKLSMVALLILYHFYCRHLVIVFANNRNTRHHKWYRLFNEAPSLLLIAIIILVVIKPF